MFQAAADYSAYAYNQSAYTNPYYYQYMQQANAASLSSTPTTVPSTQTYQLLPPSSSTGTATTQNQGNFLKILF